MVPIILNEWLLEIGYMDYGYGHGVADWSLSIIPHKLVIMSLAGALIGLNVALLLERQTARTISQQCVLACRSGFLTSLGAFCAGLTSTTVFSVACCAVPSWAGSLTVLGVETSLAFAIEPFGPIASMVGLASSSSQRFGSPVRLVRCGMPRRCSQFGARVMLSNAVATPFASPRQPPRPHPGAAAGLVEIDHVTIVFGKGRKAHKAVEETSIRIEPGEFVCILGPSGCGKSTLLNSVAGYVKPSSGQVSVDGEKVRGPGPDRGMVFQQYSLFPWKTVKDNVAFGPMMAGQSQAMAESIADISRHGRLSALRQPLSGRTVGRHAAAGRHCTCACQLPARSADGRTIRRA